MFKKVDLKADFPSLEKEILDFWKKKNIFKKSINARPKDREFVFYDGPPFATGLPHYGHFVPGTIKDIIPRYKTMKGYRVERGFGWDCHGLPVENEMKKELGISSKKEIEEYGVDKYNEKCRSIVLKYTSEWKEQIERMGRWVDFENGYRTMDLPYMESIWHVFKSLYDKGLIYEGFNILPYSPQLGCPLSNFEFNLGGYKMVSDPAITIRFKVKGEENKYFLAWTTTPWTLPSNLALCVGPEMEYAEVKDNSDGNVYILSKSRIGAYYTKQEDYEILRTMKGADLAGMRYEPLFPYFKNLESKGAFFILTGNHVTDEDGTGIVHTAPGFGEDDYKVLKPYKNIPVVCPVDDSCCFTSEVSDYEGVFVKDADKAIIQRLKDEGKLVKRESINHNYPFCYRTGAPIIYRATSCYFVDVPKIKKTMIKANKKINWIPEHLKEGRFGKWVEGAREWAISRNRFWGNPLPVWKSESGKYVEVIGSIKELEKKCGQKVTDLHKHFIDKLTWKAPDGSVMRRIPDILDCWFESGSMPYAQQHYPFENKQKFEKNFPADFICEGLDQTRGWFYTLFVIAVGLFGTSSYKNVVTNGIVLNKDGKKMSKSLRNFTSPMEIIDKYGADALRFALMNSAVTRAEDLKFSEDLVKDSIKNLIIPLWNAYSFFTTYANIDGFKPDSEKFQKPFKAESPLDRFIISRTQLLVKSVTAALDSYYIEEATDELLKFIDDLNNWYIRQSRRRFWKNENDGDKMQAYRTLYYVLFTYIKVAAPFVPFITENIYLNLKVKGNPISIHLCDYPAYKKAFRDETLEKQTSLVQKVLSMARHLRSEKSIRVRQPLAKMFVISRNEDDLSILKSQEHIIREEVNVKGIDFSDDESELVTYSAKANFKSLGPKLGAGMKAAAAAIAELSSEQIASVVMTGEKITIDTADGANVEISADDLVVTRTEKENVFVETDGGITIGLDYNLTPLLLLEGDARDLVREIQNARKEAGFDVADHIRLHVCADDRFKEILKEFSQYITKETLCDEVVEESSAQERAISCGCEITVTLEKVGRK